ncbi:hypothetical protein K438DRAFT_1977548 [Mycena galopus ATCC 62051]|nr:hypothetical protein K438DRAFT_1977548 [Mycena galopus ATCC 62051]
MLPAGTTGAALRWWAAPNLTSPSAAAGTRRTAALIEFKGHGHFETSRIFVRPTIQSHCPTKAGYPPRFGTSQFEDDLSALASERADQYSRDPRGDPVLDQAQDVKVARSVHDNPDVDAAKRRLAEAYRCLVKALLVLDHPTGVPTSTASLESFVKAAQTDLCHDESERYHVTCGLLGFGRFFWVWRRDRLCEALETLSAAKAIFEERDCPGNTGECLCIASVHARRQEYPKALEIAKRVLPIAERSGEAGLICGIVWITALYLMALGIGSYEDAAVIISRWLTSSQALGSALRIGKCLELLG